MRTIVHISDLHFGRVDPIILPALALAIKNARSDLIVVSGDLTQRAKDSEFALARDFLDTLPAPKIVVPGNHDVPLYNIFKRWLCPLADFVRYFGSERQPAFIDDEIGVIGVNTARSLTFKNGRINREQVAQTCQRLATLPQTAVRIVVTHHPFALADAASSDLVGRAHMAMEAFSGCGVDIVLSGHMHASHTIASTERYRTATNRAALLIQAGTATSTRRRREQNAFNVLRIDGDNLEIVRMSWSASGASFEATTIEMFERGTDGWHSVLG